MRVLHLTEPHPEAAYTADTSRLAASGVELRAVPCLPLWMALADQEVAVVPSSPQSTEDGGTVLHGTRLIAPYHALFEQFWARDTARAPQPDRRELNERERETLALLAEGLTDEGISRRTGLSVRTNRRTIAQLMDRLGVRSRFQAGVEAARRQWV
ncbi:helix-turn-helix transcriptional regulator [Streptomyces kronopolitis]|uniref:helix-turn-helix transcriptional regulator n=1 Tax=Streptomyces kronopolitis TaxID=1612435 RepID=UPI0036B4787B